MNRFWDIWWKTALVAAALCLNLSLAHSAEPDLVSRSEALVTAYNNSLGPCNRQKVMLNPPVPAEGIVEAISYLIIAAFAANLLWMRIRKRPS